MPLSPASTPWADARWPILLSGLAAFMIVSAYDLRFGAAVGILLVVLGLFWQLVALWFGFGFRRQASPVKCVSDRYEEHLQRRLLAEQRARESARNGRSGTQ